MLSRDIRLTERQLFHGHDAVARRRRELEKRLERTSYASKPNMEARVRDEIAELRELERILQHSWEQIGRQFAADILAGRS